MFGDLLRLLQRDIAGGHVEVVDGGEDDLQRTAFGAGDEIDAARIALHARFELVRHQQQQRDGGDAQRQQHNVEHGIEAARAQIADADGREIHATACIA